MSDDEHRFGPMTRDEAIKIATKFRNLGYRVAMNHRIRDRKAVYFVVAWKG
jgi:ribosomal protein L4